MKKMDNKKKISLKDSVNGLKQLFLYGKDALPVIILAILFASIGAVLVILGPKQIEDITNLISEGIKLEIMGTGSIDLEKIGKISLILILIYALSVFFSYAQNFIMTIVANRMSKRLRKDLNKKISLVPLKSIENKEKGDIMSLITNDVDTISQSLSSCIASLLGSLVQLIGVVIMMFISEWRMALTAQISTFIGIFMASIVLFVSQKYYVGQQKAVAKVNAHVEEIYSAHQVVRANNAIRKNEEAFEKINQSLYEMNWKSEFYGSLVMPLMNFVSNFSYVAVCVVGALLIENNQASLGIISSFMIYVRLFSSPLSSLAQNVPFLQQSAAASLRVFSFLNEEETKEEITEKKIIDPRKVVGNIEFSHVRFGYKEGEPIIKDFSASIKAGEKIAIVGPTGAGKTTLVNLLMRFYDLWDGSIKIDGIDTKELSRENVHSLFGMVLQDTWLFEGTIRENLKFNNPEIPDDIMKGDAKICGVDHFIKALPHGYHTILDNSLEISSGQKQLLTITRAMIQNAPMLILDEATSNVDTRTEKIIQEAMDKLTKNRTSFIIAHRLTTIKNADLILVLKDGNIIESGNHLSLLAKGGFYASLYNSQFAKLEGN